MMARILYNGQRACLEILEETEVYRRRRKVVKSDPEYSGEIHRKPIPG